ncbi:MAG: hypothetical protein M3N18_07340 [Actinomycetota bacterium]|nr:hypothetical protein [Actinomycetota bacterium]
MRLQRGAPVSYELTPANVAEARLVAGPLAEAGLLGEEVVGRGLLGDPAYRSEASEGDLAGCDLLLVAERADQHGERQRIEIRFSGLKRVLGLGETLAKTLVGLATRIAAKMAT